MGIAGQQLQGKTIVVGGSRGLIGRELVARIISSGGAVIGLDKGAANRKNLATHGLLEFECDLLNPEEIRKALAAGKDSLGRIDGGVFAAYPRTAQGFQNFGNLTAGGLSENLLAHVGSQLLFAQTIIDLVGNENSVSVVFVGSIQGVGAPKFNHYDGTDMSSPIEYTVAKTSLIGAARWLAARLGRQGHRFNVLSPGGVLDNQPDAFQQSYRSSTLTKGLLDPNDVANPLIFLLSDQSRFINGQNLIVDDGWSL